MVDLQAEVRAGEGAAGCRIGQAHSEIDFGPEPVPTWKPAFGQLSACTEATDGWLRVEFDDLRRERTGRYELNFRRGAVALRFSRAGLLYEILLLAGYQGAFDGTIRIGDRLDAVARRVPLFYDSGDEMHFPEEGSSIHGIGFIAEPAPLEESPDQVLLGFSIHDWRLQGDG